MNKVTFKKDAPQTRLMSVGYPNQSVDLKLKKKVFGKINAPNWQTKDNKWSISIQVIKNNILEDGNSNCKWKWIHFQKRFDEEQDARI